MYLSVKIKEEKEYGVEDQCGFMWGKSISQPGTVFMDATHRSVGEISEDGNIYIFDTEDIGRYLETLGIKEKMKKKDKKMKLRKFREKERKRSKINYRKKKEGLDDGE